MVIQRARAHANGIVGRPDGDPTHQGASKWTSHITPGSHKTQTRIKGEHGRRRAQAGAGPTHDRRSCMGPCEVFWRTLVYQYLNPLAKRYYGKIDIMQAKKVQRELTTKQPLAMSEDCKIERDRLDGYYEK